MTEENVAAKSLSWQLEHVSMTDRGAVIQEQEEIVFHDRQASLEIEDAKTERRKSEPYDEPFQ